MSSNPRTPSSTRSHPGNAAATLDICVITPRPEASESLTSRFTSLGHRLVVTDPTRTPSGTEWESFDLVLLDCQASGQYPHIPVHRVHHVVALCEARDLNDPVVLRSALRAGARDLLPRNPDFHQWPDVLRASKVAVPSVFLRFVDPTTRGERIVQLGEEPVTLGREPSNHVVFPHAFVSRRHARISRSGGRYRLEDLGSRHGTLVNDDPTTSCFLENGDSIQLGGTQGPRLTFSSSSEAERTLRGLESSGVLQGEAVNREVHDIAMLLETFLSLNSNLLLDEILELVLTRSIEFVQADRGVILLAESLDAGLEGDGDDLSLAMARDARGATLTGDSVQISRKIPLQVLASGRGAIFEDLFRDDEAAVHQATASIGIRSAMCVPLKVRRNLRSQEEHDDPGVIGVLYVDSESRGRPFSPRALDALEVLASEVAMAIYSARLYESSLKQRRFEEEMEIARQIQENIFQKQSLRDAGWDLCGTTRPSAQVGGDFLSSFPIAQSRRAILLGDVSGKGVPAALFSTMLEGLFHGLVTFRSEAERLGQAIEELNRFLVSKSQLRKFVTAVFGFLEPEGVFTFVNAGHNPGLLLRADGSCEFLEASGTILGMFDDAEYRPHRIACEPGDLLVLYSDGIPESRNPAGEDFGVDRLRKAVLAAGTASSEEIHARVIGAFNDFLDGQPPLDDVTLLVVKRQVD